MALNVYFEARGEPTQSQINVIQVTMNRVKERKDQNLCKVVHKKHAYSWVKPFYKGKLKVKEKKTFKKIHKLVKSYYAGKIKGTAGNRKYFNVASLGKKYNTPYVPLRIKRMVFY